jgi:hypothetical protein
MVDEPPPPMSLEEKNEFYNKTVIPICLTMLIFFVCFYYLLENSSPSLFDIILKWALPFFLTTFAVFAISVEILYYLKVKKPLTFHLKRFGMKMILMLILATSNFGFMAISYATLSPYIGIRYSILFSLVVWSLLVAVSTFRFKNAIRKYFKEP